MKGDIIEWVCPECQTVNVDIYGETSFPLCSNCNQEYEWSGILEQFEPDSDDIDDYTLGGICDWSEVD